MKNLINRYNLNKTSKTMKNLYSIIFIIAFFSFGFKPFSPNIPEDIPKVDSTSQQTYTVDTIAVPIYDTAYESKVVTIIQLYWTSEFTFDEAKRVLKEEGYQIKGWKVTPPSADDLEAALKVSNQLWIISDMERKFEPEHIELIKDFFEAGHGVYLLGDNADYYTDANYIGNVLVNATLYGDFSGEKQITFPQKNSKSTNQQKGKLMVHDLTKDLKHLYEGITVSGLSPRAGNMTPVVYGSDNEVLISTYEEDNKRLILDGGFTRFYNSWDEQTGQYTRNAVLWLANKPRFSGETVTVRTVNGVTEYAEQTVIDNEAAPAE